MKSLSPLSAALILAAAISAVPAALRAAPGAEQTAASPPTATSPAEPAAQGAATAAGSEGSADEASAAAEPRAERRQRGERGGGGGQPGARLLEADTDKNGLISKEEWSVAGRPEQIFTMFDTNADGNLNMDELREGVRKIRERRGGG